MNPLQLLAFQGRMAQFMYDTQVVMTMRVLGMTGAVPAAANENSRMVSEKGPAFAKAMNAAVQATLEGKRPDQIMDAGIKPLSRKVASNRKRLTK